MSEYLTTAAWFGKTQKLLPEQIAQRSTWGRVPETDMVKAASHMIRVIPAGASTVTEMFQLDPGISEMSVGEGRGWFEAPRDPGRVMVHGRALR